VSDGGVVIANSNRFKWRSMKRINYFARKEQKQSTKTLARVLITG